MFGKGLFSSKTVESKQLRVVMEVVKTKKIVNSFTKAMRFFDMDWNTVGETSVRDKIWAEVTFKSPCALASCTNTERENFECVAYFAICVLRPFKRLANLCEGGNVCVLWVTQENTSALLRATEDSSPVGTIWIRRKPTSDLVRICFSFPLLSCWWHSNSSWLLFCLQEVSERRNSECISYTRWGDPLHHQWHKQFRQFTTPIPQSFLSIKSAFDSTFPKRVATA